MAKEFQPGDRVILCTPNPSWVEDGEKASLYDTTDYFLRKVIAPTGADVALMLSGDLHHYARYSEPAAAAHHVRRRRGLPVRDPRAAEEDHGAAQGVHRPHRERLRGVRRWPRRTRPGCARARLATGVFTRLPVRNWGFLILLGILHTLLLLALDNSPATPGADPARLPDDRRGVRADAVLRRRADRRAGDGQALRARRGRTAPSRSGWGSARCCCGGCCRSTTWPGRCRSSPRPSSTGRSWRSRRPRWSRSTC